MSLDYEKIKSQEESSPQTSMSSYADLFAALAFVFLFLYVIATLQLSLETISSKMEANKYEAQLQAYEEPMLAMDQVNDQGPSEIDYDKVLKRLAFLERESKAKSEEFFEQVQAYKRRYPDHVIVSYINTSAAVKAESDILCTSRNAVSN